MLTTSVDPTKKHAVSRYLPVLLPGTYIILFISIVFCLRAVSSIAIGCILLLGSIDGIRSRDHSRDKSGFQLFTLACSLLFILQCLSLFWTTNSSQGWKLVERSSGLLLIPFALFVNRNRLTTARFRTLVHYFILIVSFGCLYCLAVATIKCLMGAPLQVFFYHELVEPTLHHAIQYSLMVFIALVWMMENPKEQIPLLPPLFSRLIIPFLSVFLLLLSSKLIITVFIFYLIYFYLNRQVSKPRIFALCLATLAASLLLVATPNPVGNRFRSAFAGNMLLFTQPSFNRGIYFNGTQFRLLEWRFTYEILNEQKAWMKGLTPGDAQSFLNQKYVDTHMYTGVPGTQKRGFLGYHTHNQFLQSLLENGLLGLAAFILICCTLLIMAKQCRGTETKWIVSLLLLYCFTDAPLQTQYGLLIFTLFPCLIFLASPNNSERIPVRCDYTNDNPKDLNAPNSIPPTTL